MFGPIFVVVRWINLKAIWGNLETRSPNKSEFLVGVFALSMTFSFRPEFRGSFERGILATFFQGFDSGF